MQVEILRQLVVWAATSEKTLGGLNTRHNKLTAAASALGIAMPPTRPLALRADPVIRWQWLILQAALQPKKNGEPLKYASLGCAFDAVAYSQRSTGTYDTSLWHLSAAVRMSGTTCLYSATTLMRDFRRGLSIIMGTATVQAVCLHFQVVIDLHNYAEVLWAKAIRRKTASWRLERRRIALAITAMLEYSLTCARPGELDTMVTADLLGWLETEPGTGTEPDLRLVHAKIPWSKPDQSGNGYSLYLARTTASGLHLGRWMRRLHKLNTDLNMGPGDPAFAVLLTKKVLVGADLMKYSIVPMMKEIANMSPPMPSTAYLKSVDWTRVQLRSFRRAGIHRLRQLEVNDKIINYFGRWKADKREAMQVRYDRLAISESVGASARM